MHDLEWIESLPPPGPAWTNLPPLGANPQGYTLLMAGATHDGLYYFADLLVRQVYATAWVRLVADQRGNKHVTNYRPVGGHMNHVLAYKDGTYWFCCSSRVKDQARRVAGEAPFQALLLYAEALTWE